MLAILFLFILFVCVIRTMHILSHTNFFAASKTWGSLLVNKFLSAMRVPVLESHSFIEHIITKLPTSGPKLQQDTFSLMGNYDASIMANQKFNTKGAVTVPAVVWGDNGAGTKAKSRARITRHVRPAILQMPTGGYNCAVM